MSPPSEGIPAAVEAPQQLDLDAFLQAAAAEAPPAAALLVEEVQEQPEAPPPAFQVPTLHKACKHLHTENGGLAKI